MDFSWWFWGLLDESFILFPIMWWGLMFAIVAGLVALFQHKTTVEDWRAFRAKEEAAKQEAAKQAGPVEEPGKNTWEKA